MMVEGEEHIFISKKNTLTGRPFHDSIELGDSLCYLTSGFAYIYLLFIFQMLYP